MLATVSLDRFAQGLADPQDVEAVNECTNCGKAIYRGEAYYLDMDGEPLCDECAEEYCEASDLLIEDLISEVAGEEVPPWGD
jgi:hypothetical protein